MPLIYYYFHFHFLLNFLLNLSSLARSDTLMNGQMLCDLEVLQ
jgi:hypothetical protein